MQCGLCSKWVHLRSSLLLQIQKSWQLSLLEVFPCCVPASGVNTVTFSDSFSLYTSTVQSSYPSANAALPPQPRLQTLYPPSAYFVSSSSAPLPSSHAPGYLSVPPDSLRVLQWNAGDLPARSTKLLHFLSFNSVDFICVQESNLNLSSSFRILGFSAIRSNRIHSWSGIPSPDATHASGGVIVFVRQGLSFAKTSISLLRLTPTLIL